MHANRMSPLVMNTGLRFASTIRFITEDQFYRLAGNCPKPVNLNKYKIPMADVHGAKTQLSTEGIMMCNAGGFHNGQSAAMFHVYPDKQIPGQFAKITKTCDELLAFLKAKSDNVRAFLVGGMSLYPGTEECQQEMADLLKAKGIPFTRFFGHQQGVHSNLHYNVKTDTWSINIYQRRGTEVDPPRTQDALYEFFEDIRVDAGDTLAFSPWKFMRRPEPLKRPAVSSPESLGQKPRTSA